VKVEVKKLEGAKRELNIEVTGDTVKNKFEDVFARIGKEAKVKGFRPGHAPRDIIEKSYGPLVHENVLRELIPDTYEEAIKKEGLEVVELPHISDVKLDRNTLSYKASVEVMPEVSVKNYKGLKVGYQKIAVSADEVKRHIDSIKESRKAANLDDNFAKELCYATLADLEKTIETQISIQKDNTQRQKIENQIVEQLTKDLDFKIPGALVDKQLQDLLRQAKLDLALKGVPKETIAEDEPKLIKQLEPEAGKQVKIYLILSAVAKKENIAQDEHMPRKVIEFLLKEANWVEQK
jgi:FKBP-type peptidyl-prolyl cis-trans isomerase (trigger factor)